ncbi:hypothetical protein [Nostoc sp.]|uniref:hypothetical protein n=1 Tax=Nostoc sp. TaxID=1180 RepID=UPI003FA5A2AD
MFNFPFEVEHIIPLSRQDKNDEANLTLALSAILENCKWKIGTRGKYHFLKM